jgi:TonB family protein
LTVYATKALDETPKPVFDDPAITFGNFIMQNLKYPEAAFNQNITGVVELSFIVETSGRISNIEIKKPLGGGCSEEAIHLLKQIKWKPGIKNGMAVRSFMKVNINFSLGENSNHQYLPNNSSTTM